MIKKSAYKKVKRFLLEDMPHIELNCIEDFDFTNSHLPYYVYMDVETHSCYDSDAKFMSKDEVNAVLKTHHTHPKWDHVVIFDIENDKIVIPHI